MPKVLMSSLAIQHSLARGTIHGETRGDRPLRGDCETEVEEANEKGRKTGKHFLIFSRYQQLDCVGELIADARGKIQPAPVSTRLAG